MSRNAKPFRAGSRFQLLEGFQLLEERRLLAAVPYVGDVEPGQPVAFLSNGGNGCCVSPVVQQFLLDSGAVVKVTNWNDILNEDGSPTAPGNTPSIIGPQPADAGTFLTQIDEAILAIPADSPLILIGHSWGGNSVLKTAKLTDYRDVEFLGLYDPVGNGGWRSNVMQDNTAGITGIPANVDYFFNRFQQNSVFLSGVPFDSSWTSGVFSPDRSEMSDQARQDYSRDSSGQIITECDDPGPNGTCNSTPSPVQLQHSYVPTDAFIEAETIAAIRNHVFFPPIVDAGSDFVVAAGDSASIMASATDANPTDTLTYQWELVSYQATEGGPIEHPANPLANANVPNPNFTLTTAGIWAFELVVTDSTGRQDSDSVVVTVTPPAAPTITQEIQMDRDLELKFQGSYSYNWGGAQEKWILSDPGKWYFITPSGAFHQWIVGDFANSPVIATFGTDVYADPSLLHAAYDQIVSSYLDAETLVPKSRAVDLDLNHRLYVHSNGTYLNYSGLNEKWLYSESGTWFIIRETGDFYRWNGGSNFLWLARIGSDAYTHIHRLAYASLVTPQIVDLDESLSLQTLQQNWLNWGGLNEKWLKGDNSTWFYLTPTGDFYQWHGGSVMNRTQIDALDSLFYTHSDLLTTAFA